MGSQKPRPYRAGLFALAFGGMTAGMTDIFAAALIYSKCPEFILQSIASGLLGPSSSFEGGLRSAALGLLLQCAMSLLIASVYVAVANRFHALRRFWFISGSLYGVAIFIVMNYAVVPLSAARPKVSFPHFTGRLLAENLAAMLVFGLIVAFFDRRCTVEPRNAVAREMTDDGRE